MQMENTDSSTYPKLCHQDVSDAAQNCHTVKNIPGIFEIILSVQKSDEGQGEKRAREGENRKGRMTGEVKQDFKKKLREWS